jgi:hypothetical protein
MKKTLSGIIAVLLSVTLTACDIIWDIMGVTPDREEEPIVGDLKTAPVIFDRACGSAEENIQWETVYSYDDISLEEIIDSMSSWSGLNFNVTVTDREGGLNIDWAADSSLITEFDGSSGEQEDAPLIAEFSGMREQTESYVFEDADTLRWFMMDSMKRTLNENGHPVVYYTMDGGKELIFDELYPVNIFPADIEYMGSPFYFAHAGNRGDDSDVLNINEESAMDILTGVLSDLPDGTAIVAHGRESVYGDDLAEPADVYIFAYGANHEENFVAEKYYAVSTSDGTVYEYDIIGGVLTEIN